MYLNHSCFEHDWHIYYYNSVSCYNPCTVYLKLVWQSLVSIYHNNSVGCYNTKFVWRIKL